MIAVALLAANATAALGAQGVSYAQPAHSLAMPFDVTEGRVSFLYVSRVDQQTDRETMLATHWAFWSDSGDLLAESIVCLGENETIVVDPLAIASRTPDGATIGEAVSLRGQRGFATATGYAGTQECAGGGDERPIDGSLVGGFTLADIASGSAFGHDAIGFGLSANGSYVDIPVGSLPGRGTLSEVGFQMLRPDSLDFSVLILLGLREQAGSERFPAELGPLRAVQASSTAISALGESVPLRDIRFSGAHFAQLDRNGLIPDATAIGSASLLVLSDPRSDGAHVGGADRGSDSWIFGLLGQAIGQFGTSTRARFGREVPPTGIVPAPQSTPAPTPSPTRAPSPTTTPRPGSTPTPSPSARPTPSLTPIFAGTPSPPANPAPTPGATPVTAPPPTPSFSPPVPTTTAARSACVGNSIVLDVRVSASAPFSGIDVTLPYRSNVLTLPGAGNSPSVLGRIEWSGMSASALFAANHTDASLRLAGAELGPDASTAVTARITFDCTDGGYTMEDIPGCTAQAFLANGSPAPATCGVSVAAGSAATM